MKLNELIHKHRVNSRDPLNGRSLTQERLGEELNCSAQSIGHWEQSRRRIRDRKIIIKLITVFYQYKGLHTPEEADTLLRAAGFSRLSLEERRRLFPNTAHDPVPAQASLDAPADARPQLFTPALPSPPLAPCPYRGLDTFEDKHAKLFFGRAAATEQLHDAVISQSFTAVIGPSGSGKSSLVFAGLLPRLQAEQIWISTHFRPENRPFYNLSACLMTLLEPSLTETDYLTETSKLVDILRSGEVPLFEVLGRILDKDKAKTHFLLVVDQFEELYTLCPDADRRHHFLDVLLGALAQPDPTGKHVAKLLLTLRADFLGQALHYRPLADALQGRDVKLGPMTQEELQQVIEAPAAQAGVQFENYLVARILDDLTPAGRLPEPGDLPLLEFALTQLWERQTNGHMTHKAYDAIGQVKGALAGHAEDVYAELKPDEQAKLPAMLVQLVHPGAGTEDTRRLAGRRELGEAGWFLVQKLAGEKARLVVTGRDEVKGQETVEVVHEALIQRWGRLQMWMTDYRNFRQWQERLRTAMALWEANNQDREALLRGLQLAEAEGWLTEQADNLSSIEHQFIQASLAERDRKTVELEAQRQRELELERRRAQEAEARHVLEKLRAEEQTRHANRFRVGARILLGLLIIALIMTAVAVREQQSANRARDAANHQWRIALAQSIAVWSLSLLQPYQSELATLLALEAAYINQQETAGIGWVVDSSLRQALSQPYFSNQLRGNTAQVLSVAFSPDGKWLASCSDDTTIHLWDLSQPDTKPIVLSGHHSGVRALAFNPTNGNRLASGSLDHTVQVWDLSHPDVEPIILRGHQGSVRSVAFSPTNGNFLASGSYDGTVRIWDLSHPDAEPIVLHGHQGIIFTVAFSPDGNRLASGSTDQTIRVWNLSSGSAQLETVLQGYQSKLMSVAFSPDGKYLASGSTDNTIQLWDVSKPGDAPMILQGHSKGVQSVAFSPDGNYLASGSEDQTIRIWNLDQPEIPSIVLYGHKGAVQAVAFSPDGKYLASGGDDQIVRLWTLTPPKGSAIILQEPEGSNLTIAFSLDGNQIIGSRGGKTMRTWTVDDGFTQSEAELPGYKTGAQVALVSADGQRLAYVDADHTIQVWTLNPILAEPIVLPTHEVGILSIAFSPDGQYLAGGGDDKAIYVWDLSHPGIEPTILRGHTSAVHAVAFSPDGQYLASGGDDQTVRVWNLKSPKSESIKTLWGHEAAVQVVAFSPDGQYLASGSDDQTIQLWHFERLDDKPDVLKGHEGAVWSIAFAPDENQLASGSEDQTVRIWDLSQPDAKPTVLSGHEAGIQSIAFSPDGSRLASGSADQTVRIWLVFDQLVSMGCAQVRRNMTWEEWQQYMPGELYRLTCPQLPCATDAKDIPEGQIEPAYITTCEPDKSVTETTSASPTFSAETPTPSLPVTPIPKNLHPVYVDDLGPSITSLPSGWTRVEPGGYTRCAYNTPFVYWVHPGTINRLLIYFQAEDGCWNARTCASDSPFFNAAVTDSDNPLYKSGIFHLDNPNNPFRNYSIVYIPTCTGDLYWGDNVINYVKPEGGDFVIYHRGFVDAHAALDWAYHNIPDPESVFVSGCGSVGTRAHVPYIIENYPNAIIAQLGDSNPLAFGHPVEIDPYWGTYKTFPNWIPALAELAAQPLTMAEYDVAIANYYPDYTFALYNANQDSVQAFFYVAQGGDAADFPEVQAAHLNLVHAAAPNFRSYTAAGESHCILPTSEFYTLETSGVLFRDWVDDLANDRSVSNVVCPTCGVHP